MPVRLKRRRGFVRRPAKPERDGFYELDMNDDGPGDTDEFRRVYLAAHGRVVLNELLARGNRDLPEWWSFLPADVQGEYRARFGRNPKRGS